MKHVQISDKLHKRIKLAATAAEISIKSYVTQNLLFVDPAIMKEFRDKNEDISGTIESMILKWFREN